MSNEIAVGQVWRRRSTGWLMVVEVVENGVVDASTPLGQTESMGIGAFLVAHELATLSNETVNQYAHPDHTPDNGPDWPYQWAYALLEHDGAESYSAIALATYSQKQGLQNDAYSILAQWGPTLVADIWLGYQGNDGWQPLQELTPNEVLAALASNGQVIVYAVSSATPAGPTMLHHSGYGDNLGPLHYVMGSNCPPSEPYWKA